MKAVAGYVFIIGMNMQTSELAKLALFLYLARLISKKQDVIKDFKKGYLPLIILWHHLRTHCSAPIYQQHCSLVQVACYYYLSGSERERHLLFTVCLICVPVLSCCRRGHKPQIGRRPTGIKRESIHQN
jgi:cell division protein FtsW